MANNPITTPLPADLPTDWVYGQTIGPNGTDVGLSKQHGYNYLMQQVNAAQQAAEEIGEAFSGLPSLGSDGKIPKSQIPDFTAEDVGAVPMDEVGEPGGVASLDDNGVVPGDQMPGYTQVSSNTAMGQSSYGGPLSVNNIRGNTILGGTPAYDAPVSMESVESPIRLHVVGKNLVDLSGASVTITSFGVTCTADAAAGTMTLSGTCDRPGNNSFLMPFGADKSRALYLPAGTYYLSGLQSDYDTNGLKLYVNCYNSANQSVGTYGTSTAAGTTFTLIAGAWCTVNVRVPDGMVTDGIVIYPQIEAGTEKTAFEPYQGEVVEVPLLGTDGQELEPLRMAYTGTSASSKTAWHDRIVRKDGLWCVMRSAVERDLTDAVWSVNANYAIPTLGGSQIEDGASSYFVASTHFASRGENGNQQSDGIWFGTSLAVGNKVLPSGADTTAEEMGQWCAAQAEAGTPVRVCYVLAQPIFEELHQDVQVLLNTLSVPGGVCSVWFEGEIPPSSADIGIPRGDYPCANVTGAYILLNQHMQNQNNPHGVTASQVSTSEGGNVENSLSQKIDKITTLSPPTDLNSVLESGNYRLNGDSSGFTNGPSSGAGWGLMSVVGYSSNTVAQILYQLGNNVWTRVFQDGTTWSAWAKLATLDNNGILPVAQGGTGVPTLAQLAQSLFPTSIESLPDTSYNFAITGPQWNGNGYMSFQALMSQIATSGVPRITTGSYVGTGTYGQASPTIINTGNTSKFLIVTADPPNFYAANSSLGWFFWFPGITQVNVYSSRADGDCAVSQSGATISWYNIDNASYQLNTSGTTYRWISFG